MLKTYDQADLDHDVERAKARVAAARKALVDYVGDTSADHLIAVQTADLLNTLAKAEGRWHAASLAADAHGADHDPYLVLAKEAERGPDDEWSGRTNDVRRSVYEGFMQVLRDLSAVR